MDQEVEEVSFLPGEAILNKKAVYEPTKGQRFRQIVCTRGWAICILLVMGMVMVSVAVIAAFARPASIFCSEAKNASSASSSTSASPHEKPQTYIATNNEPFPWRNLLLPKTIVPDSYNIFLHANISESYFKGRVQMVLKVVQDTDFIVFHSLKLNVSEIEVRRGEEVHMGSTDYNVDLRVIKVLEYPRNEQFYVKVASPLKANSVVLLQASFRGSLASLSDMDGFYKSSYTVNGQTRYMASTHFEATSARSAFPCFDEPALKANFTMSMVRDESHITLFNTPLKRTSPYEVKGGLVLDEYESSVKMSTYLVAFVVCDFKNISKITKGGVLVRVFAPEDKIYMGQYALDAAVTILERYNTFFGVPYPLPKQDLIAIPNFEAGAMENWGLITYRESNILYDPQRSTESSKGRVVEVVAHELAHQWFGNLVTLSWWNDLWLNEGFASFVELIGADAVDSQLRSMDKFMFAFTDALYLDSLTSSHPIEVEVKDPAEIEAVFDTISYDKGASLIRMLRNVIGDDHFKGGLTEYLLAHEYGNAETKDLWEAFQDVSSLPSDLTVSNVMDTWTKQMGYPVVTVARQQGKLVLSQQRFLLSPSSKDKASTDEKFTSPYNYKWNVPFTYITSANPQKQSMVWMKKGPATVSLEDSSVQWVKGNMGTMGFYRVNYDLDGWKAITKQLLTDHTVFSVADRIGIIDDVFSLARAGLVNYTVALDLSKYLVKETDYFVWRIASTHLGFIQSRLDLEAEYDLIKAYLLSLAKPRIQAVGWEDAGSHIDKEMRASMISLAVNLDYKPTVDKAVAFFNQWMKNSSVVLNNDLRGSIYMAGLKYCEKPQWDVVFDRYLQEKVPAQQALLLAGLAAPMDTRILHIFLEYSLDNSKVKSQDTDAVIANVAANDNGLLTAWRFVRQYWTTLFERFGEGTFLITEILKSVTTPFNTQFDYDEITAFFSSKDLGSGKQAYSQALEVVQSHIQWAKDNMGTVKAWLQTNVKQEPDPV